MRRQKGSGFFLLGFLFLMEWGGPLGCSSVSPLPNDRRGYFDRSTAARVSSSRSQKVNPREPRRQLVSRSGSRDALPARRVLLEELPKNPGGFQWPLQDVEVTSLFGRRGKEFHEGIDLRAPTGTPVYAAQSGVVLYADARIRGYGKLVVIRHPGKVATIYAHNSKTLVRPGERVVQGQKVAISGSTGHVRGAHVHFEIRRGLSAVNPLPFLPHLPAQMPKKLATNRQFGRENLTALNK